MSEKIDMFSDDKILEMITEQSVIIVFSCKLDHMNNIKLTFLNFNF